MATKYPFYLKSTIILFGLTLTVYALSNLGEILIPLAFAGILAIVVNPLCNWLQGKKVPRSISIILALLAALLLVGAICYLVSSQLTSFTTEMPLLKQKCAALFTNLQNEIDIRLGIKIQKQNELLSEAQTKLKPMAGNAITGLFGTFSIFFLLPIYAFMILYYKILIINFIYEIFAKEKAKTDEVATVLSQTKGAMQSYMFGLLVEALIVAVLNSSALLLIGVKYAILIGVIGALLNMIPYIGGIIAIAIPVLIATITKDGFQMQLCIIAAYAIIQFIDNNLLVPYIVSSKVKINALVSIVIVLLGGTLWGISGMFLSIPFIGVLKIIFDRMPELKPWGKLLGDEIPTKYPGMM